MFNSRFFCDLSFRELSFSDLNVRPSSMPFNKRLPALISLMPSTILPVGNNSNVVHSPASKRLAAPPQLEGLCQRRGDTDHTGR